MSGLSGFFKSLMGRKPAFVQVGALCLRGPEGLREVLLVSSLRTVTMSSGLASGP